MRPRLPPARTLSSLLAFGAGLLAGLWALERALPKWGCPVQLEKLALFEARRDQYDTIFLGPSTLDSGLDPEVFDAICTAAGHPTCSINLGFPGAHLFSLEPLVEDLLARRPARLRRIVLQCEGVHVRTLANWPVLTPTMIGWHDLSSTREVLELFAQQGAGSAELTRQHWNAFAHHLLGAGRARSWVEEALGVAEGARRPISERGFRPHGAGDLTAAQRRSFVRKATRWLDGTPTVTCPRVMLEKLERIQRRCDAAGVELVVFTVAGAHEGSAAIPAWEEGRIHNLVRFDDVTQHPVLFHPNHRFDHNHFNTRGARVFSMALAEALLAEDRAR